jgi:cytochrome bd-type quinol oxidase subunit 2
MSIKKPIDISTSIAMIAIGGIGLFLMHSTSKIDTAINDPNNQTDAPLKNSTTNSSRGLLVISTILIVVAAAYFFTNLSFLADCNCPKVTGLNNIVYSSLFLVLGIVVLVLSGIIRSNSKKSHAITKNLTGLNVLGGILTAVGSLYVGFEIYRLSPHNQFAAGKRAGTGSGPNVPQQ